MRPEKRAPLGICDLCTGRIPLGEWYTSKGRERLHCSTSCKATANSRAGAPIRSRKALQRVQAGEWVNPRSLMSTEEISRVQTRASRTARRREVAEGHWRNPALDPQAKRKLSRPRKHRGALARAIEKLGQAKSVSELTPAEQRAHRAWAKRRRAARRDEVNALRREWDRRRWENMTEAERQVQRAKWREQNKRRAKQ